MSFRLGPDGKPIEVESSFAPGNKTNDGGTLPPRGGFNSAPTAPGPGGERTQPPAVDLFNHLSSDRPANPIRPGGMAVTPEPPTQIISHGAKPAEQAAPDDRTIKPDNAMRSSAAPAEPKTTINFGSAGESASSYVCGWLVVVDGPGKGKSLNVCAGQSAISRSATERLVLNFGDTSITSKQQLLVIFDDEYREFIVAPGNGSSLNRLNGQIIAGQMPLKTGDILKVGATTLRFVAFCDANFNWQ